MESFIFAKNFTDNYRETEAIIYASKSEHYFFCAIPILSLIILTDFTDYLKIILDLK